jgi:hypothetical protein
MAGAATAKATGEDMVVDTDMVAGTGMAGTDTGQAEATRS